MNGGALIGGRYQLLRGIGAGGMGEVWEAVHTVTRKRVAIKVLNGKYARQPSVRARFLLEARAACRVRHPNVVQVHDVLELDDGAPAMVMDLLEGESLSAKLEREVTIAIGPLASILAPVVDAMMAAHALRIVHRDLKPDNLFLERLPDGGIVVKVLDFGIAKVTETDEERGGPDKARLTGTGAVLGTPYYMSPEQAFGEKDLDYRSDVWSLGVILYECLSGARPTEGDNFGQILKMITTGSIPSLAILAPHVPADIVDVVMRMLKCDRTARPELREVLETLRRYKADSIVPAAVRRVTIQSSAPQAVDPSRATAQLDETAPAIVTQHAAVSIAPRRGHALRWAAVAACAVALLGGGIARSAWTSHDGTGITAMASNASPGTATTSAPAEATPLPAPAPRITPEPAAETAAVTTPPPPAARPVVAAAKKSAPAAAPVTPAVAQAAPATPAAPAASVVGKLHTDQPF